jgi:hypothetical protein
MDPVQDALAHLREVFARYPVRAVLEGCPHCRGDVSTAHPDLFALSLRLGNTVGTHEDLKSFLPALFAELVSSGKLDETIVVGRLDGWREWPEDEQEAVDAFLLACWSALLRRHPAQLGSFYHAADFLLAVQQVYSTVERFLRVWEVTRTRPADRHLADAVEHWVYSDRAFSPFVVAWLHRPHIRTRLYLAFSVDPAAVDADAFARAFDFLGTG